MSGSNLLIDTNIALYLFKGDEVAGKIVDGKIIYYSFINELELLGYRGIPDSEIEWLEMFLEDCNFVEFNPGIKTITINLRRRYSLKLPDAIIAATAIFFGIPLLSADKHFEKISELVFIRYSPTDTNND